MNISEGADAIKRKRGSSFRRPPQSSQNVHGVNCRHPTLSSPLLHLLGQQHHARRSCSPPRGHLLLRVLVARSRRGLLDGDALLGFPPEEPTGERAGERCVTLGLKWLATLKV